MILLKAVWLAMVDVFKLFKLSPKVFIELFWSVMGVLSLVLSIVLFPFIVYRKYKNLKPVKKTVKRSKKFKLVKV